MQPIPFRNLLCIALLLPLFGIAADNPFSRFSPKWDAPVFRKAKPSHGSRMSNADLELAHMVNLIRMDPLLFGNSVLIPHARSAGKIGEAKRFMKRAASSKRLNAVTITLYHRYRAKVLLDSLAGNGSDAGAGGGGASDGAASARFVWKQTMTGGPFEILMGMLLDGEVFSPSAIEAMLGEARTGGVLVRRTEGGASVTALVLDVISDSLAKRMKVPDVCDHLEMEERRFINYSTDTTDAIMNRVRKNYAEPPGVEVRVVDDAGLKRIQDSLDRNRVSNRSRNMYYEHEIDDAAFGKFKRDPDSDRGFPGGPRSWSYRTDFWTYPDKSLYAFSIRRQEKPCDGIFEVEYKYVEVLTPEFRYHPDSIGRIDPSEFDFTRAHIFTSLVEGDVAERLAAELTKPFDTELEKVWAIFHWLHGNIEFDSIGLEDGMVSQRVEDVLKRKKGLCVGMADAFKRLCELSGLRAKSISGYAQGSSMLNHQWNAVNIDGAWYLLDVTWGWPYFLMPPEEFLKKHLPRDNSLTLHPKYVYWGDWSDDYFNKYDKE